MSLETAIGIDACGGDTVDGRTPAERTAVVVRTIAREHPNTHFILVGEEIMLNQHLRTKPDNIEIVHGADRKYGAVKKLCELASEGNIEGFYSLANSKVLVPAVNHYIGTFDACAKLFPGQKFMPLLAELPKSRRGTHANSWYLLDVGAVPEISAENYIMYAHIGRVYASVIGQRKGVRVALLNIGSEDNKGTGALQQAHDRLSALLPDNSDIKEHADRFIGNVEAYPCLFDREKWQATPRPVDVVVTDAFSGNIAIKFLAGGADVLKDDIRYEVEHGGLREKGAGALSKPMYDRIKSRITQYGVAKFPCSKRAVCKGHGTTGIDGVIAGVEHLLAYVAARGTQKMETALGQYAHAAMA